MSKKQRAKTAVMGMSSAGYEYLLAADEVRSASEVQVLTVDDLIDAAREIRREGRLVDEDCEWIETPNPWVGVMFIAAFSATLAALIGLAYAAFS